MNTIDTQDHKEVLTRDQGLLEHSDQCPISSTTNIIVDQQMMIDDHYSKSSREHSMAKVAPSNTPKLASALDQHQEQMVNSHQGPQEQIGPTLGTFENTSFEHILAEYNQKNTLPPTLELTQAFLLATNLKEAAARVQGLTTTGGSTAFMRNEIVSDQLRLHNSMISVNRLLRNIGSSDLASNFLLEQRNLMRAQATENKTILSLLEEKIVDGLEYVKIKESIAETKSRVKHLLDEKFTSDEEAAQNHKSQLHGMTNGMSDHSNLTSENSEIAHQKHKQISEKRIRSIIQSIRQDAKEFLKPTSNPNPSQYEGALMIEGNDIDNIPLPKLLNKLRKSKAYRKKRQIKALQKGSLADSFQQSAEQLRFEIKKLDKEISGFGSDLVTKNELKRVIGQYEQVIGLEKRVCVDAFDKPIAEVDAEPMNAKSYEIQNSLFDFCGLDITEDSAFRQRPLRKGLLGNIKKVPLKSSILQSFKESGQDSQKDGALQQAKKQGHELVKVIGLEPEKIFSRLEKYKVNINKMPTFSNVFERAEPMMPSVSMTVPGQVICSQHPGGSMTFARIDGRSVISLPFNPYFIKEDDDQSKKKEYDSAIKEIQDQREKIVNKPSKVNKEKLEQSNIKKAWMSIIKKDIPKAYKQYQKFKADQENNIKKQCQNCLKEVRKKALKTQRLQKECQIRAKKLNKDMMTFWKKRDKEITDLKKRKDKMEKELRKKMEEEREAELQKKRLEFIMQQSEIYAHFMSKKLGLSDELQKQKQVDMDEEQRDSFKRVEIDTKEARQNIASMINDNRSRVNEFDQETQQRKNYSAGRLETIKDEELEIDKFDNPDASHSTILNPPRCLLGHLKHYQLKGLRWLDNLYEQGINGILADEMGLGKTIQAIALLAHLFENKGIWGPFLIIVPCTVLSNWQNELQKFCPALKVLPFFGTPEERKKLGKFLDPKNLYNPNLRINVILTSYNLIVNQSKDQQKLLRVKWHYMILDEAQAIKNNLSRRWRVLLQFNTRNRLLLTGTPIQNSMAELWALLHFIMPKLFDSHEQFQEWFSKDIEANSLTDQGEINKHQLRRLHLVLKPFMLRRLKDDIELEIGPKQEFTHTCVMTHRQKLLYQRIKNKISTRDLFKLVESKAKMENLMNLVMQFRKVCNHPELFERRIGRIPLTFNELQVGMLPNPLLSQVPDLRTQMKNPISFEIPKLIYDECFLISDNQTKLFKKIGKYDGSLCELGIETHMKFFNIFNTSSLYYGTFNGDIKNGAIRSNSIYSILRLLVLSNKWSYNELSWMYVSDPLMKQIALMHFHYEKFHKKLYKSVLQNDEKYHEIYKLRLPTSKSLKKNEPLELNIVDFVNRENPIFSVFKEQRVYDASGKIHFLEPLITEDFNTFTKISRTLKSDLDCYVSAAIAYPIIPSCSSSGFNRLVASLYSSPMHKKALIGSSFKPRCEIHIGKVGRDRTSFFTLDSSQSYKSGPPTGYGLIDNGILGDAIRENGASILELPNYSRLVTDCAKMKFLDKLLSELKVGNHRVLIFCQMTKMLDILEDFLCWRKYTYFRMDGSTNLQDRRFMVEEFQKNPTIFAFLLSTRAGGLGVNLTAADTVIFYDNDWNPTIDAQAQDRAHRIGQTKPVSVYRLITKQTVEEKIVKRAKQKQTVQSTVYGGNALKADVFRPKDVVDMLLDEEEEQDLKERQQKFLRTKRVKRGPTAKATTNEAGDVTMIDTTLASNGQNGVSLVNGQKKKEQSTPVKPRKSVGEANNAQEEKQKSTKKGGTDKVSLLTSLKQSAQIFATAKAQRTNNGPILNGNGFHHAAVEVNSEFPQEEGGTFEEEEEQDDNEEDDDFKAQKLLELLEKDDDEEGGVAIEYHSGDEAANEAIIKAGKAAKAMAAEEDELMEDDDMMGDEY